MPSPLPTTSLVAVASARILAAYLTNHKLSPAEAASLGGKIAHTLGRLTGAASLTSDPPYALAEQPEPRRQGKARVSRPARAPEPEAPAVPELAAPMTEAVAEPEPEPEPELEPELGLDAEPVAEPAALADQDTEDSAAPAAEPVVTPEPESQPEYEAEAEDGDRAEAGAVGAADVPRKRKRPSRPRSKRGKGSAAAPESAEPEFVEPESAAMAGDEDAEDEMPPAPAEIVEIAAATAEIPAAPAPVAAGVADEEPEAAPEPAAPKPRRVAGRPRRVSAA